MRFPELHGRDLDGRSVELPTDVGPDPTLLLVRFSPRRGREAETWLSLASELTASIPDFWCYDLLVLPEFPADVRESVTADIHATLTDGGDAAGVRSLTAHTDIDAFRRVLVLDRPAQTYALVLREGRIRWRAFGPLTTTLERRLRDAITAAVSDPATDVNDLVIS
jgi:hypothetical protein